LGLGTIIAGEHLLNYVFFRVRTVVGSDRERVNVNMTVMVMVMVMVECHVTQKMWTARKN
jgi:hypothetical protein